MASVPVQIDVIRLPALKKLPRATFGLCSTGDSFEAYRALKNALSEPARARATRQIHSALTAAGFNSGGVAGPYFSRTGALVVSHVTKALRDRLYLAGDGKRIVSIDHGMNQIQPLQPGTVKHRTEVGKLVKAVADEAAEYHLTNYALHCAHASVQGVQGAAQRAAAVRAGGGKPAVTIYARDLAAMDRNLRNRLFADLDTLLVYPGRGGAAAAKDFKSIGEDKTLLVRSASPDPLACGFYCWAVRADGVLFDRVFSHLPLFNAFFFNASSLLLPTTAVGSFEPTLAMMQIVQGRADYDLARRCEALASAADARKVSSAGLQAVLDQIRSTCDRNPPVFDPSRLRSSSVSQAKVLQWRRSLLLEAEKVAKAMAKPPSAAPRSTRSTSPPAP